MTAQSKNRFRVTTYFMALLTIYMTLAMVYYPKDSFDAATIGLQLWWDVVFPALLPFFILSEILMGLGVVHGIGVLLEPLMRPLFKVPGAGAFALSMGLASGYPMDAVITCKLREAKLCTATEAERLLSFTNTADPLFMFGAVAVGMFGLPELGACLAAAHYISSFLVGILFRFHGTDKEVIPGSETVRTSLWRDACRELLIARQNDGRAFGQLLGDAVKSSMQTILLIGGFIMLFSVFLRILTVTGCTVFLHAICILLLNSIGFQDSLALALVNGLFEIDLGALAASQAVAPLPEKAAVASAIIAWSGFSVHGQVASIVIESGIRMGPYMVARLLHAFLAAVITVWLCPASLTAGYAMLPVTLSLADNWTAPFWLGRFLQLGSWIAALLLIMVVLSLAIHILRRRFRFVRFSSPLHR